MQYVYEEELTEDGDNLPPLVGSGYGSLLRHDPDPFVIYMTAYLAPGNYLGSHERFDVCTRC